MDTANFDTEFTQADTDGKILFVKRHIARNKAAIACVQAQIDDIKASFARMRPIEQCLVAFVYGPTMLYLNWLLYRHARGMRQIETLFNQLQQLRARKAEK